MWVHFENILNENWKKIFDEEKFFTTYIDWEKEITLRIRVKEKLENKVILEVEKEILYDTGEDSVRIEIVEVEI